MSSTPHEVPPDLQRTLRLAVAGLRATQRRLRFPPGLHVGHPAAACASAQPLPEVPGECDDDGLRVAIVSSLLLRARTLAEDCQAQGTPIAWLTRPGVPAWHDLDAAWLGPARQAYAEADLPLRFVVVTKRGWYDPLTGVVRSWVRLRLR